ncbi:hypothetical protein [Streptomyces sp. NBC_00271]|uniref:hypothetical protein n=1 Tax=Streptomyces sp. NBC_00271 TaxID=2975697 RepID=UPI002E28BB20|nr:hypothetical protein [Streptomyces sp. NBC_00271]
MTATRSRPPETGPDAGNRRPGQWPAELDRYREQWAREQGRRALVIDSIRAHLAEQPSPRAIRAAARRWCTQITNLADDLVKAQNSTESTE